MAISQDLLEIMICPACKGQIELQANGSSLRCQKCQRIYPIENDIPSMLIVEECPACGAKAMMQSDGSELICPECGHRYSPLDHAR